MQKPFVSLYLGGLVILNLSTLGVRGAEYRSLMEIPIGGAGGFDYLTADPSAHRLYVSHGTKVVVIDTEKNSIVGEVAKRGRSPLLIFDASQMSIVRTDPGAVATKQERAWRFFLCRGLPKPMLVPIR